MTTSPAATLVRMNNGHLVRDQVTVFRDLSLSLSGGQRLAVLGPNGIGKTSLSMVLSGRLRLSRGELELLGTDVQGTDIRNLRPRIGYFSDEIITRLDPSLTALEVVALGRFSGLRREWFDLDTASLSEANTLLTLVGLGDYATRSLDSLSAGQRQRVLLARAFSGKPRLTVLDEPTSHLDLVAREQMIAALQQIVNQHHSQGALVMVAHHLEDLPSSMTHALIMSPTGHWFGTVDEIITSDVLTHAFGHPIHVYTIDGRRVGIAVTQAGASATDQHTT